MHRSDIHHLSTVKIFVQRRLCNIRAAEGANIGATETMIQMALPDRKFQTRKSKSFLGISPLAARPDRFRTQLDAEFLILTPECQGRKGAQLVFRGNPNYLRELR